MKRSILIISILLFGLVAILPSEVYAGRGGHGGGGHHSGGFGHYGGGHYYGGGRYYSGAHYHGGYGYSSYGTGVFIGAAVVAPLYYPVPSPVYEPPPPAIYDTTGPEASLEYPDSSVPPEEYAQDSQTNSAGEWITVPGQYVDGSWIPEHRVWVSEDQ